MWQSDYIEANGIKLHYTRTGGDKPPIVLAHGITDSGLCWTAVAETLAENYDVIMVDARGHGRSDSHKWAYDQLSHTNDLYGLIQALKLEKPVILGHSMGAMIALTLAGNYPEVPRAILLEDPGPWWVQPAPSPDDIVARREQIREQIRRLKSMSREDLIEKQRQSTPRWSQKELEPWADAKLSVNENVVEILTRRIHKPFPWSRLLANIKCPVLLITADPEQGAIVTGEAVEQLQSYVPHVQVESIADAGHCIHRDQFDTSMDVIQAFLADL